MHVATPALPTAAKPYPRSQYSPLDSSRGSPASYAHRPTVASYPTCHALLVNASRGSPAQVHRVCSEDQHQPHLCTPAAHRRVQLKSDHSGASVHARGSPRRRSNRAPHSRRSRHRASSSAHRGVLRSRNRRTPAQPLNRTGYATKSSRWCIAECTPRCTTETRATHNSATQHLATGTPSTAHCPPPRHTRTSPRTGPTGRPIGAYPRGLIGASPNSRRESIWAYPKELIWALPNS